MSKKINKIKIKEKEYINILNNKSSYIINLENVTYHRLIEFAIFKYILFLKHIPILTEEDFFIERDGKGYENIFIFDSSINTNAILRLSCFEVKSYEPNECKIHKKHGISNIVDFSFTPKYKKI